MNFISISYFSWVNEIKPTPLLQRIFDLRKTKKISLTRLGKVLGGVGNSAASHIENGDVPLKAEYIPAIAKLLGLAPWELFIDPKENEIGLLSERERELIVNFRKINSGNFQNAAFQLVKKLSKNY